MLSDNENENPNIEPPKANKHKIKHLFYDMGFNVEHIRNLTGASIEEINKLLGAEKK